MHCGMLNVDVLLIHLALSALIGEVGIEYLVENQGDEALWVIRDAITPQMADLEDVFLLLREKGANIVVVVGEG